jgi:hypothetical protein
VTGPRARQGRWRKSSASGADNCVEVAFDDDGNVRMRSSRLPTGPIVTYTSSEWAAFLLGVKDGEFDGPGLTPHL